MENEKEIRYFSMFTGVGGFELGLERASNKENREHLSEQPSKWNSVLGKGDKSNSSTQRLSCTYSCVGQSEIDKYASELLKKRFPSVKNWGDCTKINPSELPDFDMLCGGFPCQAFSIAGKRRGFKDTRGTLFFEISRILKVKRPKLVLLENVKGLLNHEKGKTFSVIIQTLEELGYRTQWMVLNSKFFGVPQNRERVFIIGSLRGESRPEILPFRESSKEIDKRWERIPQQNVPTVFASQHKIARGMPMIYQKLGKVYGNGDVAQAHRVYSAEGVISSQRGNTKSLIDDVRAVLTPGRPDKRQNGRRFKGPGEPSFTITKQDIHGIMEVANSVTPDAYLADGKRKRVNGKAVLTSMHERRIRRLTPTECERLQGFPDGWTEGFSDTQRYKMMGNAVTVNVIAAIGGRL